MNLTLGEKLNVRSMIYVAGKAVPFFWPMRAFIHHNPLHGFESLPFAEAAEKGSKLFHGRAFLPRETYQSYLADDLIDRKKMDSLIEAYAAEHDSFTGLDLAGWIKQLLYEEPLPVMLSDVLNDPADTFASLHGEDLEEEPDHTESIHKFLGEQLLGASPLEEALDALYGSKISEDLNELFIKSCLDFYDEGQAVWKMPLREDGFFNAWKQLARRNFRFTMRGLRFKKTLNIDDSPEGTIIYILRKIGIDQEHWAEYFTGELAQLHGWSGFVRWREQAKEYHYNQKYPGDLVDFVAVRLTLALALIEARSRKGMPANIEALEKVIEERPEEAYLRYEFHQRKVLPHLAHELDKTISSRKPKVIQKTFTEYTIAKRAHLAREQAKNLFKLAPNDGQAKALKKLKVDELARLLSIFAKVEKEEGMLWLRSMEQQSMQRLSKQLKLSHPTGDEERPFVQSLFCIDTRSERIRRHLEETSQWQTFGIAGFFGVPINFIEFGKGSGTPLCPVILSPKNSILEITADGLSEDLSTVATLDKAMHGLKEAVISPFVTVEAIGMLFGFEMIGKTLAPKAYAKWRKKVINTDKPDTLLLLDKPTREKSESILFAVQRALVIKALQQQLRYNPEGVSDSVLTDLRKAAMGEAIDEDKVSESLNITPGRLQDFIKHLQDDYHINAENADLQMEQLGRVGFSFDEQANFVATALKAIGLTENLARFVLIVGHGSFTENNPYESALDCGACGGNHGLVSARVIAQMANRSEVRSRVRKLGIDIPEDVCFIPALHNTTTDEVCLHDLDRIPPSHLFYLDLLRKGLTGASELAAQERLPTLSSSAKVPETALAAFEKAQSYAKDWSQVRPEWGLSRNCFFVIGRRDLTSDWSLDGRAFLHSYNYRVDPKGALLESILTGPLVVGQWINMEHYFSAVDNEQFGSGSKIYHNVSGKFGVMSGNLSDLRTGLPSQTVLKDGKPFHEPVRLMALIEAPFEHATKAIAAVASVQKLVKNEWIRIMVADPDTNLLHTYEAGEWSDRPLETPKSKSTD